MIDKEKMLDFLKIKYDAYSNKKDKNELLEGLIIEYSLLWSIISMGNFDIEKPKETCKWKETSRDEEFCMHYILMPECKKQEHFFTLDTSNIFKYCPYCGKEVVEVEE